MPQPGAIGRLSHPWLTVFLALWRIGLLRATRTSWLGSSILSSNEAGGQSLAGLQVGSFEGGADVVADGMVQPGWATDSPALIAESESRTRIWALVADSARDLPVQSLSVASSDPSVAVASVRRQGASQPGATAFRGGMVGTAMQPLVADMSYTCYRAGAALLTVTLQFAIPGVAPVEFATQKECAACPRQGLNLGTAADQADDVMRDGTSLWTVSTATQRLIPFNTQQMDLFWALRPTGGSDDTASQLLAPLRAKVTALSTTGAAKGPTQVAEVRRWRRALLLQSGTEAKQRAQGMWGTEDQKTDDTLLRVHFRGELGHGGRLPTIPAGSPEPVPSVSLQFECLHAGTALVEIEVATSPAYQPYRPAVVSFLKQCGGLYRQGFDVSTHAFAEGGVGNLVS